MDTSFIVICLVLVGSVFIPFFLFNALGKTAVKKMNGKVKQFITEKSLTISESEYWGNSYIGLDINQGKILFVKLLPPDFACELLDLSAINDCQLNEIRKILKIRNKKELLLEKLDLEIMLKNGETIVLNFYDNNDNRAEDYEYARAEKWKTLLIRHTSNSLIRKRAA